MNSQKKTNKIIAFINFLKSVKVEASKIIWPNRQNVFSMAIFVLVMAFIASLFFYSVDLCCFYVIGSIVG